MLTRLPALTLTSILAFLVFLLSSIGGWAYEDKAAEILNVEAEFQRQLSTNGSIEFGFGALWATQGDKLLRIDATNNSLAEIKIEGGTTRQRTVAVGEGAIWIADAGKGGIFKVDPRTNAVVALFSVPMLSSQGTIGVGEGAVWVVTAEDAEKTLTRLNAADGAVETKVTMPSSGAGVTVAYGSVWVTSPSDSALYRVDPNTNAIVSTTKLRNLPRYLTWGADSIWVLNSGDATVQRVDATTAEVTATIKPNNGGNKGDIAFGGGYVWLSFPRMGAILQIDPGSNRVAYCDVSRASYGIMMRGITRYGSGSLWTWTDAIQRITPPR
jgi:virginiamycin B lyase